MDDLDELPSVPVIKVVGAADQFATAFRADAGDDFLGILVKELRLFAAHQREQGAAEMLRVATVFRVKRSGERNFQTKVLCFSALR